MIRIAIDLELHNDGPLPGHLNPPCGPIIQVGYTFFSTRTGILHTDGNYIKTGVPLSPYIQNLTGITENDIDKRGVTLHQAYLNMVEAFEHFKITYAETEKSYRQLVEWGSQDSIELKGALSEVCPDFKWYFGNASLNVKAVYQMYCISNDIKYQGGLGKSLKNMGLEFEPFNDLGKQRGQHDARADSLNTAKIYLKLQEFVRSKGATL